MVKYSRDRLDVVFAALADPTRRGVIATLAAGTRPVSELAQPYGMSLPGFMKHLRILEDANLIVCAKQGRTVNCTLSAGPMEEAVNWLARYQQFWSQRLDALARYLEKENAPWPQSSRNQRSRSSANSRRRPKKSGVRSPNPKR